MNNSSNTPDGNDRNERRKLLRQRQKKRPSAAHERSTEKTDPVVTGGMALSRRRMLEVAGFVLGAAALIYNAPLYKKDPELDENGQRLLDVANNDGADVHSFPDQQGELFHDPLYAVGQLHANPLGDQYFWEKYHDLFCLITDLHRKAGVMKIYNESAEFEQLCTAALPKEIIDFSDPDMWRRIYKNPDLFREVLEIQSSRGGHILNFENLLANCFPSLQIVGAEDPTLMGEDGEYNRLMKEEWKPALEAIDPILQAINRAGAAAETFEEFMAMEYVKPVLRDGAFVAVSIGGEEFDPAIILDALSRYERAAAKVDALVEKRDDFTMQHVHGVMIIGQQHLQNFEKRAKGESAARPNRSIHTIYTDEDSREWGIQQDEIQRELPGSLRQRINALRRETV